MGGRCFGLGRRDGWRPRRIQRYPVMLVIGTFAVEADQPRRGKNWMEISSVLEREKAKGAVKQIDFVGSGLDMSSVLKWRRRVVG